jgi:probable H4MPT-linked C1 transfer pathway protein
LKAVLLDAAGHALAAKQVYCPLWRGLQELDCAIEAVLMEFNAPKHIVTMTGELADIFPDRHSGVVQIAQKMQEKLSSINVLQNNEVQVRYYAGSQGIVTLDKVTKHTVEIASMNWLASVQYLAQNLQQAILIDIGSTTTDIALVSNGQVRARGFNDATRMQCDELVYTGVVRTPLMALAQKIPFAGQLTNIAAEHFATTADVYTLTGDLADLDNMAETADGAQKSVEASALRIARMVGADAKDASSSVWQNLAYAFKHVQLNMLKQALLRQISLLDDSQNLQVIGAGAGTFLVCELAEQLGFNYTSITHLIKADNDEVKRMAAVCFPAFAVAQLAIQS